MHRHGRIARGGHGLPNVSPGRAMPYPSMPLQRWPACRVDGLGPSSTALDTPKGLNLKEIFVAAFLEIRE
jgi:hypothetical protein